MPSRSQTAELITAALITALAAASAWIAVPLGAVPVTLQTFVVVLAALLLSPRWAAASMGAYLLLGAIGVPVFSGGRGGLGVLAGPTGGFLLGFLAAAASGAFVRQTLERRLSQPADDAIAAAAVILTVYAFGVTQLALVAGLSPAQAIAAGALPFVLPDIAKAAAAVAVASAVRRARAART